MRDLTAGAERSVVGAIYCFGQGLAPDFGRPGTLVAVGSDRQTRRQGLYRIGDGEPAALVSEHYRRLIDILINGDAGERWVVGPVQDATHPQNLFAFNVQTGEERRLTTLNPQIDRLPRATARFIPIKGLKGEARQAALWLPPDYQAGRRYPTVVMPSYGDGAGISSFVAGEFMLAARGYAVLRPDMPLVSDVGPAEAVTGYVLNALEAAAEQGYADPERAGLFGHSRTGYQVCCVVTGTGRFRAAVASAPYTDLVTFSLRVHGNRLTGTSWVEGGEVRMPGTLWQERQRYIDNSPVFHLDRVTTPLLLLCGTADDLLRQAEELYAGLLRLGKTATLVRYHGEGHAPGLVWSPENYDDYWSRILGWLDTYVRGA
ncbi:MAG: alpha/beta hydrolase family protein [Chloroflexota bacterium]